MIERAYTLGEQLGLAVWCEDEAGPYRTLPYPGESWQPEGQPARRAHEYKPNGTAKMLTLFHPKTGEVRVKGVTRSTNAILHPWMKAELSAILKTLPSGQLTLTPEENREVWESWRKGLSVKATLPAQLPPLRLLLVLDNLAGHKSPELLLWFFQQGIMPLYTPLGGSWLNMVESVQGIIKRRALDGHHPTCPTDIIHWLEATARGWNAHPTPFEWGGKRKARRQRAYQRRHRLAGSGALAKRPLHAICPLSENTVAHAK